MGSLWALALPLFFCCWEAGAPGSSAGANTQGPSSLVTMNHTEVPAVTLGVNTSLEGASETIDLAQAYVPSHTPLETLTLGTETFDKTLLPASTIPEAKIRETQAVSPATETRALTKITPSKSMSVVTTPVETSATSDSPSGTGMTTVETVTDSDLLEAVFHTLCTDDSSEEDERITMDVLTWAHTSAEARALALESNSAPDITSQAQEPDITVPPKASVAYRITNIEATNCNIIEIEETAIIPGTSDIDHSPTGGKTPSIPDTSALPDFTKAKSHLTRTTSPSEALSADRTTESVETLHTANSLTGETTAAKATAPSETLVTVSMNPLEETSALSVETTSHAEVLGEVTISTEAGSTVGRGTSSAESSVMGYSLSDVATIKESTRSETSTTDSTTSGPIPISRGPLPSVHLAAANSSQETDITLAKTTASPKSSRIASMAGGKSPVATPTTARTTGVTTVSPSVAGMNNEVLPSSALLSNYCAPGGEEGFLLLRLSVASPEDLTDPRVAERLMHQLRHELHAYLLPIQVSLLRVRRD